MSDVGPTGELGQLGPIPGIGLLGIEIGATIVRMVLLDSEATVVTDAVERPILAGDGMGGESAEGQLQEALAGGLDELGLSEPTPLLVGATIGRPNCGVGSGPALEGWLKDLSSRLRQPFLWVGGHGVSYAPAATVEHVRRLFRPLPLSLDRLELAPVSAWRAVPPVHPGEFFLGSGVPWSARTLGIEVVEAYELDDGPTDEMMQVIDGEVGTPISGLERVRVPEELCRRRGLTAPSLAPAVGVATALRTAPQTNLLEAKFVGRGATVGLADPNASRRRDRPGLPTGQPSPQAALTPDRHNPWGGQPQLAAATRQPGLDDRTGDFESSGHRGRPEARNGSADANAFDVSDFVLGALVMLAVVLAVVLVIA